MTILTHDGKVFLAWAGPCPGVEAELTKARRGEDGYAVIDGAAWADYLPGDDLAEWDATTGKRLVERPKYIPTKEESLNSELSELLAYLSSTDWCAIRLADSGKAIPEEVIDKRSSARERISEIRELIKAEE